MLDLIRIENIKLKGKKTNLYVILTVLIPFFIGLLIYLLMKNIGYESEILSLVYTMSTNIFIMMLFPVFTTYITFIIGREEHLEGGWKLLFTYPVEKKYVYISKILVILINQIKVLILFSVINILIGLSQSLELGECFYILIKSMLALIGYLPFLIIVFYISMKFTTVAIPMSTGIVIIILNSVIINSETYSKFVPTTYGIHLFLKELSVGSLYMVLGSGLIFILLMFLSLKELERGIMV